MVVATAGVHYGWAAYKWSVAMKHTPGAFLFDPSASGLPAEAYLLVDSQWATPSAQKLLEQLRRKYPYVENQAAIDCYLTCWDYWNGNPVEAKAKLRKMGRVIELIQIAVREKDWAALGQLAENHDIPARMRVEAYRELAQAAAQHGDEAAAAAYWLKSREYPGDQNLSPMKPLEAGAVSTLTEDDSSFSTFSTEESRKLQERLPGVRDVLRNGTWATDGTLKFLQQARQNVPGSIKALDIYTAAWYCWHGDAKKGDETLWGLGLQNELAQYYEAQSRWDKIQQIAQDEQAFPTARVTALSALARRAQREGRLMEAKQYWLEALGRSGLVDSVQRQRVWEAVRAQLPGNSIGTVAEISWGEYYQCLRQMAAQSPDPACLAQVFFEMRKMETLDPELRQPSLSMAADSQKNTSR